MTTDVTLPFLSAVDTDAFFYFLCHMCGLINQLYQQIFVVLVIEFPVQLYQRKFHGKHWFPTHVYVLNELQLENKRPIT